MDAPAHLTGKHLTLWKEAVDLLDECKCEVSTEKEKAATRAVESAENAKGKE